MDGVRSVSARVENILKFSASHLKWSGANEVTNVGNYFKIMVDVAIFVLGLRWMSRPPAVSRHRYPRG